MRGGGGLWVAHDLWVGTGFRGSPQSARGGLTRLSPRVVFASPDGETVRCPLQDPAGRLRRDSIS